MILATTSMIPQALHLLAYQDLDAVYANSGLENGQDEYDSQVRV